MLDIINIEHVFINKKQISFHCKNECQYIDQYFKTIVFYLWNEFLLHVITGIFNLGHFKKNKHGYPNSLPWP